jgi:GntR family transcriptional repressor for pyruvate dehydrogenase complex
MKVKAITAHSASDMVVQQILANISSGDLLPGDRLPTQEKLGELFGVGRSSIREATNALAVMGYLEITQGRGTFVKQSMPRGAATQNGVDIFGKDPDLLRLLDIREILECHSLERVAERGSQQQLAELREAAERLSACLVDVSDFLDADLAFHQAIAIAAGNPELGEIVRHIHNATNTKLSVAYTTATSENIEKAIETAIAIMTFVERGELGAAKRCLRNHLDISRQALALNNQKDG